MKISAEEATRLARNYPLSVRWSDEDRVFVGSVPGLVGDCCHGDTPEAVIPQLWCPSSEFELNLADLAG
jgi:hypothetical protein